MNGFLLKLLANAVKDPDIRAFLLELAERVGKTLLPGLASVIPAATAAGIKALGDILPDLHLPQLDHLTEEIRGTVNALLPEDVDIPILSDAFESLTGFDLSDIITGRHH